LIKIDEKVAEVIKSFVEQQQSFISLDVYCKLGQHFDVDMDNPVHEQVRAAYGTELMPNYLCKWSCLRLEGGGFANCWKYYLPKVSTQTYSLPLRADGRIELSKKVLGQFSLLECEMGLCFEDGKITLCLHTDDQAHIVNAASRVIISANIIKAAKLDGKKLLSAETFPNKIEITEA